MAFTRITIRRLEMQELYRIPSEDAIAVLIRHIQLLYQFVGLFDVHPSEVIGADHHAVGSYEGDQESQGLGVVCERVVMESPHILLKRTLQLELSSLQAVFQPSGYIREAAPGMRQ